MSEMMAASLRVTTERSMTSMPSSSRKYINDIPPDMRAKLCTEIDYTLHRNEGYWQKLVSRLGFDETHSKKFRLSFEMHGSPTDNLLRDCSYRMLRIRHLYNVLMEIGLNNLAEDYLKDYDTEEPLPPLPNPSLSLTRSTFAFDPFNSDLFKSSKGARWPGIDTLHFSFDEIKEGTHNFSPKMELGAGAFGKVYKVFLNKTLFACKVLKIDKENQLTTSLLETHRQHDDLRNELNYLAEYRHPNVIALYGWSLDGPDPCLIYDYMKNGSLQDRLQCSNGSQPMSWDIRIKVSCGAARGLQFLHTKNSKPLIHGDIKTANILLDNSFTAKLGDFGLAREMPHNAATGSYIRLGNEHTPGTLGYLANEYIITKKLSVQVDTYAFGVVLLELYTGRRAFDRTKETPLLRDYMDEIANSASKLGQAKANERLLRLQDPRIAALFEEAALKFVRLALACCHEKRRERPKMSDTLAQLNEIERKVAVANGREPEESLPPPAADGNDDNGTNTLQRRRWLMEHNGKSSDGEDISNLSRNPVESVDHSLIMGEKQLASKLEASKSPPFPSQIAAALGKKLEQTHIHDVSSSDDSDSQGRSSNETTNSGRYYVQRAEHHPHLFSHGHMNSQLYPSYHSSIASGYSSSVPPVHSPHYLQHGYNVPGMSQVRMGSGPVGDVLYAPGHYSQANRSTAENPYKLDLSKVPRHPCYCPSCSQVQPQNISPLQSQVQWPGQIDCSPETFTSFDYKAPSSYPRYSSYFPSKVSSNGDVSPNGVISSRPGPSANFREATLDSYSSSVQASQANSFCFYRPSLYDDDDSDDILLSAPALSVNPFKESLLDKLKDGQSYTQIFPDAKRKPTETGSEENIDSR